MEKIPPGTIGSFLLPKLICKFSSGRIFKFADANKS